MNSIILKNQHDTTLWKGSATQAYRNQIVMKLRTGKFLMKGEYLKIFINDQELRGKSLDNLIDLFEIKIRELLGNEDALL